MKRFEKDYLLARAKVENAAAERAACLEAARAHAKLAELYFDRLNRVNAKRHPLLSLDEL